MPIEEAIALHRTRVAALHPKLQALPLAGRPLTLEIGCGHGHFLAAYAAAHPGEFCLAIDLIADRLDRAERKSTRSGLTNVAWLQAEADDLLAAWPPELRVARNLFILFPDPWPKRRHWKNRLIRPGFLSALAERTEPGVRLCFRTDHGPYFEEVSEIVAAHPDWQRVAVEAWSFEQPTVFQDRAPVYHSLVARRT